MSSRALDPVPTSPVGLSRRALLSVAWGADEDAATAHYIRVHRRAMACRFEVTLPGQYAADIAAARDALEEADRLEELLVGLP